MERIGVLRDKAMKNQELAKRDGDALGVSDWGRQLAVWEGLYADAGRRAALKPNWADASGKNVPRGNIWTVEDIEKLRALVAQGQSVREIAAELSRTEGAVRTRCVSVGIKFARGQRGKKTRSANGGPRETTAFDRLFS